MMLLPMLHGEHTNDTWKWRKTIKIVNAVLVFCNSGQRNCLSEIWRWKLAVSVLHFLLYVCSETHNCKMSQKSAGPHYENCAFRVGRIAKTEKCKKWSSKISFDKKQPKQATTKKQASAIRISARSSLYSRLKIFLEKEVKQVIDIIKEIGKSNMKMSGSLLMIRLVSLMMSLNTVNKL